MKQKILIVEDNVMLSHMQKAWLEEAGYSVCTAIDEPAARKLLRKEQFDLVLSDVRLPVGNGIALLEWLNKERLRIPFVTTTDYASCCDAVRAVKLGAKDYLPKPVYRERLLELTGELLKPLSRLREEKEMFKRCSPKAKNVERLACLVAPSDMSVLILGANGTGKESIAQSIHQESDRRDMPFVAVNCGGIPQDIASSLFFGHVKGAFTGADSDREGYFGVAQGGTLFLDEIGNLPYELQGLLLRVLQEHVYMPVGSHWERKADVRIIAATNENLRQAIREGRFREDLFYRLNEFELLQPSLFECQEDILPLARFFLKQLSQKYGRMFAGFTEEAESLLLTYSWPGNIRELKNCIRRAVIISENTLISASDIGDGVWNIVCNSEIVTRKSNDEIKLRDVEKEKMQISLALEKTNGNVTKAATLLGISRTALYGKMKRYNLK